MSETERLIDAVRGYPLLYNTSHADYKNFRKREEAWYNISESFEEKFDVEWKKKWKNLKDSYVKYLKSENPKTAKEHMILRRYKSWPWASKMEFIRPFCKLNKPSELNSTEKQWFELPDGVLSEDSLKGFPEDETFDPCDEHMNINQVKHSTYQDEEYIEPEIQHIDVDSLRFDSKEDKPISKASKTKKRINSNSTHNDIELILMGYAKTIKTFSPKRQAMVKFKFSQILMEAELAQLEEDESNGTKAKRKMKSRERPSSLSYEFSN